MLGYVHCEPGPARGGDEELMIFKMAWDLQILVFEDTLFFRP